MTSWQTTIAGILLTVGTLLVGSGETGTLHFCGMILAGIGGLWMSFAAKDYNKH